MKIDTDFHTVFCGTFAKFDGSRYVIVSATVAVSVFIVRIVASERISCILITSYQNKGAFLRRWRVGGVSKELRGIIQTVPKAKISCGRRGLHGLLDAFYVGQGDCGGTFSFWKTDCNAPTGRIL